jgi:hypothetical protein
MSPKTALIALIVAALAPPAAAQSAGPFANRAFDVTFTEVQLTDDPERPEIPQNRNTHIEVGVETAATRITRNYDKPPPGFEQLDAMATLGAWASLDNRAAVRHEVTGQRLVQTIISRGFVSRLVIDLDGKECRVRIDNALQPGEPGFRLRNIALGTPMLVKGLRIDGKPSCAVREAVVW